MVECPLLIAMLSSLSWKIWSVCLSFARSIHAEGGKRHRAIGLLGCGWAETHVVCGGLLSLELPASRLNSNTHEPLDYLLNDHLRFGVGIKLV